MLQTIPPIIADKLQVYLEQKIFNPRWLITLHTSDEQLVYSIPNSSIQKVNTSIYRGELTTQNRFNGLQLSYTYPEIPDTLLKMV